MKNKWKTFGRAVSFVSKDFPIIWPIMAITAILVAAEPFITIYFSTTILSEVASETRSIQRLVLLVIFMSIGNFLWGALRQFFLQVLNVLQYVLMQKSNKRVAEKAWQMDYKLLSDPKIHEWQKTITNEQLEHGIVAMLIHFQDLFHAMVTIGISAALTMEFFSTRARGNSKVVLFLNHWSFICLFLILFALTTIYNIWSVSRIQKENYRLNKDMAEYSNQRIEMISACCAEYQKGKDIRIFHEQEMLLRKFESMNGKISSLWKKSGCFVRRMNVSIIFLSRFFNLFVHLMVGMKAVYKAFDVGSLLKYIETVAQLGEGITLLFNTIQAVVQNIQYLEDYFAYLDVANCTADSVLSIPSEICENYEFEFRHVTFTYPGASTPSLTNICCRFGKGEQIAVVGRNGSGKTTFIKLLCRLYDPQEGQILLNGIDIRKYCYEEYLKFFSTVFQDYYIFAFTLGENVAMKSEYNSEKVMCALKNAGLGQRLSTLINGLDTQLLKNFSEDGIELSGGESQKIAMARCFYKDAYQVVVDEPTAALDPVAEAEIYHRMNQFVHGKGIIYISHRLSSCRFCSKILVFEGGKLVEQGTHNALLKRQGLYNILWNAQVRYYQDR